LKRDTNLIRTILLKVQESNSPIAGSKMDIPEYTREQIYEHAHIAKEHGFVDATLANDKINFVVHRLTAAGHEFLDGEQGR
jgi:hypothetical protein